MNEDCKQIWTAFIHSILYFRKYKTALNSTGFITSSCRSESSYFLRPRVKPLGRELNVSCISESGCQIFVFNIRSLSLCVYSLWTWIMGGKCLKWFKYKWGGGRCPASPPLSFKPQYTIWFPYGGLICIQIHPTINVHSLYGHRGFYCIKFCEQTLV